MTEPVATKTPLWIKLTLMGSLAVNLLIVGVVAGAFAGKDRDGKIGNQIRTGTAVPLLMALERDDRRALRDNLRAAGSNLERDRINVSTAMLGVLDALRADPFDAVGLEQALSGQASVLEARNARGRDALLEVLIAMPAEERLAYATRLEEVLTRRPDKPGPPRP